MSSTKARMLMLISVCLLLDSTTNLASADEHSDKNQLQVGYAVVTPGAGNTSGLAVFETFGETRFGGAYQAGVLPADLATSAMLFVTTSSRLSRNLGVAVANPQATDAGVTFTLNNSGGTQVATKTVTVKALNQSAQFVTQLFAGSLPPHGDFDGTLFISSSAPVALVGLRFRGENFSTIPVTVLSPAHQLPVISTIIGGAGAIILPQFAVGGGWASEIVLSNSGNAALTVRVDLFSQNGTSMTVTLNGKSASSFQNLLVPPKGVLILAPRKSVHDDDDF